MDRGFTNTLKGFPSGRTSQDLVVRGHLNSRYTNPNIELLSLLSGSSGSPCDREGYSQACVPLNSLSILFTQSAPIMNPCKLLTQSAPIFTPRNANLVLPDL